MNKASDRTDKVVYVHRLNGEIVYIGSGGNQRVTSKAHRIQSHLAIWDQLEKSVVSSGLNEDECKKIEKSLIELHWNSGKLLNKAKHSYEVLSLDWKKLDEVLYYDETSSSGLRWKINKGSKARKDQEAGNSFGKGYYQLCVDYISYLCHRVVYSLVHKVNLDRSLVIDHINGIKSDNRIENLRAVNQSTNCKNTKKKGSNTGYQNITERLLKYNFKVHYREDLVYKDELFSFHPNQKPHQISKNHYQTRELALEAAIAYRDTLVQQGLIVLT